MTTTQPSFVPAVVAPDFDSLAVRQVTLEESHEGLPAGTGNATTATEFVTTAAEANISIKVTFFRDNQDISCWPVKPDVTAISGAKTITVAQKDQWVVLAANVLDGTRFKLRCGAVGLTDQVISATLKF